MKSLKTLFILTILVVAFLCTGFAAALNQDEAIVHAVFSSGISMQAGQTTTVTLLFASLSNDSLSITYVGIHFDWMPTDTLLGFNLSTSPVYLAPNGGQVFPINVSVPLSTSSGSHTYFVEFDGTQGSSATTFAWDSAAATEEVSGGSSTTGTPTSTPSSGGSGDSTLILYAAVIVAVVVIVAALIMFLTMRKKRTKPQSTPKQSPNSPETPAPEKKPETGQDFNI